MTSNLVEKLSLLLYLIYGTISRNASDWSILSVSSYPAAIYMGILYIVAIRALHSIQSPNIEFIQPLLKGMCVFTIPSFSQVATQVRNLWFCEGRILNSLSLIRARFLSPDGWDSCDVWKAVIDRENQPAWHSKDSELKEFRLFRIQSLSRYFLCLYSPCCRQQIKACLWIPCRR